MSAPTPSLRFRFFDSTTASSPDGAQKSTITSRLDARRAWIEAELQLRTLEQRIVDAA